MHERQEREYPLRVGSVIQTEEGILFSRSSPSMVPILSDPEAEIDDVLEAYGDSLDEATRLREALEELKCLISICECSPNLREDSEMIFSKAFSSHTEDAGVQKKVPVKFREDLTCSACLGEPYHHSHTYKVGCADYGITIPGITDGGDTD